MLASSIRLKNTKQDLDKQAGMIAKRKKTKRLVKHAVVEKAAESAEIDIPDAMVEPKSTSCCVISITVFASKA